MSTFGDDWFDDYMEMKIATGEDDDSDHYSGSNGSNNSGCLPVILGILVVILFLSKL